MWSPRYEGCGPEPQRVRWRWASGHRSGARRSPSAVVDDRSPGYRRVVRRCTPAEWAEVRHLHIKVTLEVPWVVDVDLNAVLARPEEDWRRLAAKGATAPDQALFVAPGAERLVGMGQAMRDGDEVRLAMLFVDAGVRRRGVGRGLLGALEAWAALPGVEHLVGHVPEGSGAEVLVEGSGWRRTDDVYYTTRGITERRWVKDPENGYDALE